MIDDSIGYALKNSPEKVMTITGNNQIHVVGGPYRATVDVSKFEPTTLMKLVADISALYQRVNEVKGRLEANGAKLV
jgi:hypothetical protein